MRVTVAIVLLACLAPAFASAQTGQATTATAGSAQPSPPDDQEARMRFGLGQRYYDQGRFEEAAVEFQAAYDASGRDALLYNVYIAHRDAGHAAQAATALRAYLATDHPEETQRANLNARLSALERQSQSRADSEPAQAPGSTDDGGLVLVGAIVAGIGVVTALASIGPGLVALDGESQLAERCPDGACPAAEASLIDDTRTLGVVTDILWVGGAVVAAAGATLLAIGLASAGSESQAALVPTGGCTPDGCFGGVEGSF